MSMTRMTPATIPVERMEAEATSAVVCAFTRLRPASANSCDPSRPASASSNALAVFSAKATTSSHAAVSAWKEMTVCSPSAARVAAVTSRPVEFVKAQVDSASHAPSAPASTSLSNPSSSGS